MAPKPKFTVKSLRKERVRKLRENGVTHKEIARRMNISIATVGRWLKEDNKKKKEKCSCKEKSSSEIKRVVKRPVQDPDVARGFKRAEALRHLLLAMGVESPPVPALVKGLAILDLLESK